jgi:hypothetical protein
VLPTAEQSSSYRATEELFGQNRARPLSNPGVSSARRSRRTCFPKGRGAFDSTGRGVGTHPPGVWFLEEAEELSVSSDRYDLTLTLLHLPKQYRYHSSIEPELMDTFVKFSERQ